MGFYVKHMGGMQAKRWDVWSEFHTGFAMGPIRQASCVRNDPEQGAGAEVVSAFQGAVPLCDGLS